MRQVSIIYVIAGVGLGRRYSALRRGLLCPQRQSNQNAAETSLVSDFPFWALAHGSRQKKRSIVSRFSHKDPSCSYFACRPSPPYIARYVCRFRSRRWAKMCGGECHPYNKALQRKGRYSFSQPQERASGANAAPIRYPRAENRTGTYSSKNGDTKGCPLGELWVLSFSGKYPVGD